MTDEIRVLVAVEVRLYREGLGSLLSSRPEIAVVATAADVESALAAATQLSPDIILLDTTFADSVSVMRRLLDAAAGARVVALAITETDAAVLSYAEAGMSGYVSREGSLEHLIATIISVANGEFLCSPRVAAALLRRVAGSAQTVIEFPDVLTRREQQVMELISQHLSNKAIARRLNIEVSTVKNHVHHILEKLRVSSRQHLATRIRRSGMRI